MPPGIADAELLRLLGDILRPRVDPSALGLLRVRLMRQGFSWQALVDLATDQDVLAPLVQALSSRALLLPVPQSARPGAEAHVTNRLNDFFSGHVARRRLEKAQLERVLVVLNRVGVIPVVLKGGRYVAAPHASWCEARTVRDFDLLVRPEGAGRAMAALQADGYRPGSTYMDNYHHLPNLERTDEPATVEIHTEALAASTQAIMSTDFVWENAVKLESGRCFILPARWQALQCLLHHQVSDHGYRRQTLAVKALWEWAMLAQELSPSDWEAIVAHMRRTGAVNVLGSWFVQSNRLFGTEIPGGAEVSPAARANAEASFRWASRPYWIRRARFIADQLRFSFAPETLGRRYSKPASSISVTDATIYLVQLIRAHHGQILKRLMGERDRPS
jgi:hypothetical protein